MKSKKLMIIVAIAAVISLFMASCSSDATKAARDANKEGRANVKKVNESFSPPEINGDTEYHNYMGAQKLYDDPSSIIWCTTTWGNDSAPLVTVPIAGKLTSSSVSLFPSVVEKQYDGNTNNSYHPELPSVDGMFHGSPPPYRYGFTPGGQYVDFFNMPTFCTTALTAFQRESTKVVTEVDGGANEAQKKTEAALAKCKEGQTRDNTNTDLCPAAQKALDDAVGN